MDEKEIEELEDEDVEVEYVTRLDLNWTCKSCGAENSEYDIPGDGNVICICEECNKKYQYYNCIY